MHFYHMSVACKYVSMCKYVCTYMCVFDMFPHRYLHFSPPPLKLSGILAMEEMSLLQKLLIMYALWLYDVFSLTVYENPNK